MNFFPALCLFVISIVTCLGSDISGFDRATANTSVWLSEAAYCETDTFLNRTFHGYAAGFVARYVVDIPEKDVQVIDLYVVC